MKKSVLMILLVPAFLLLGCGPSRDKMIAGMKEKEKSLYSPTAMKFDTSLARDLVKDYSRFIDKYPDDSMAGSCLLKAANLSVTMQDGNKAIEYLDAFMKKYPDNPRSESCLFTKGFVYGDILKNYDKARETYQVFLEKYPNSQFAMDAQMSIMNLGKTPEQIVREIEARRTADSIRHADSLAKIHPVKGKRVKK